MGMSYGVNNHVGQPSFEEAHAIVSEAWQAGVKEFDTAQAYGTSEKILGRVFDTLGISGQAKVLTKLDPSLDVSDPAALDAGLERSLGHLKQHKLAAFMLHHEKQLDDWDKGLGEWLVSRKGQGKFEQIGVSVYSPLKALEALANHAVDLVQVPSNMLDRRFEKAGVFNQAKTLGKKIYIRSIFLQGLILMEEEALSPSMSFAGGVIRKIGTLAKKMGLSRAELAFVYVNTRWPQAKIVIGVETAEQLRRNIALSQMEKSETIVEEVERVFFNGVEDRILNPSLWAKRS